MSTKSQESTAVTKSTQNGAAFRADPGGTQNRLEQLERLIGDLASRIDALEKRVK
jgi:hypothetical protein